MQIYGYNVITANNRYCFARLIYAPDYLENKYTLNGLTFGYVLEKRDIHWFWKIENESNSKTYTNIDIQKIQDVFVQALKKMKEIKKDYLYSLDKYYLF